MEVGGAHATDFSRLKRILLSMILVLLLYDRTKSLDRIWHIHTPLAFNIFMFVPFSHVNFIKFQPLYVDCQMSYREGFGAHPPPTLRGLPPGQCPPANPAMRLTQYL